MAHQVREPVVAGQFYPAEEAGLRGEIEQAYLSELGPGRLPEVQDPGPRRLRGAVCPHAGYMYSGATAAHVYAALAEDGRPQTVVILGPSHALTGVPAATQTRGVWRTPLGDVPVDEEAAQALQSSYPQLADTPEAFAYEHSLEVQLPFLQHLWGDDFGLLPLMMVDQGPGAVQTAAAALVQALQGRDALLLASTDMTHQEPPRVARQQDLDLADYILDLDPEGLLRERRERGITMCGAGPAATMLQVAKELGATQAEILSYHHSGEVAPMPRVVGYLSAVVY
jgi:AmmeMemoRadiSam system protein B